MSGERIDGAVHIWSNDHVAYPWAPHNAVDLPSEPATAEQLTTTLATVGFAGAVCVQPRVYGYDHAYLVTALRSQPGLVGICLVNPVRPTAPEELRLLVEQGCAGVRLLPLASEDPDWLDGSAGDALWETAETLDIPVSILARPDQLLRVRHRAVRHPSLSVVLDHLGSVQPGKNPDDVAELLECASTANIFVKVSAFGSLSTQEWPYRDLHDLLHQVAASFGPDRMIFGTDWPYVLEHGPYDLSLQIVNDVLSFSSDDQHSFLGGNARRLWWRERP